MVLRVPILNVAIAIAMAPVTMAVLAAIRKL